MSGIASSPTHPQQPSTRALQQRVYIYLPDTDTEASEDSSVRIIEGNELNQTRFRWVIQNTSRATKRRKVAKQTHKPVYINVEPTGQIKTYSVATQWKPFPKDQSIVKWTNFVRKIELRNQKNIDIYEVKWSEVEDYNFEAHPEFHTAKHRFVDSDGISCSASSLLDCLARHQDENFVEDGFRDDYSEDYSEAVPDEVDSCQLMEGYISDLE